MHYKKRLLVAAITPLLASTAWATNGYFSHGVGQKSQGMGGAGVAFSQDTLAGGVNPAGMVHQATGLTWGSTGSARYVARMYPEITWAAA